MAPRTPLLHPDRYFADREPGVGRTLAVVALVTVGSMAGVYAIGWVFADRIDGTVTMDNPERPPEAFCDASTFEDDGCDQPREVERNIDEILSDAVGGIAGQLLWAMPLVWLLVGLLVHAGSWLAGGEGSAGRSFAVTAWGLVPSLAALAVGVAVLAVTFDPVTVTPADEPAVLQDRIMAQFGALRTAGAVLGLVTTAWGAVVWRFGLERWRGLSGAAATAVATVVALLVLLFGAA